jgi:hypothetical protein
VIDLERQVHTKKTKRKAGFGQKTTGKNYWLRSQEKGKIIRNPIQMF